MIETIISIDEEGIVNPCSSCGSTELMHDCIAQLKAQAKKLEEKGWNEAVEAAIKRANRELEGRTAFGSEQLRYAVECAIRSLLIEEE